MTLEQVALRWHPEPWRAPQRREQVSGLHDGQLARLMRARGRTLELQPTGYFDHLATNLSPHAKGPMADPLGINGLVWDSAGHLVVLRRSRALRLRPGQLAPGFSGALEQRDLQGHATLAQADLLRELREELGPVTPTRVRLLGLVREVARHGTPDLFVECWLPVRAHALPGSSEGTPIGLPPGPDLWQRVQALGELSIPLQTAWALRLSLAVRLSLALRLSLVPTEVS